MQRERDFSRLQAMLRWQTNYEQAFNAACNRLEERAQREELYFPAQKGDPVRAMLADAYLHAVCATDKDEKKAAWLYFSELFRTIMVGFKFKQEMEISAA